MCECNIVYLCMHVVQALVLEVLGERSKHWKSFDKQLTLRAQLYVVPNCILDQTITLIKCVSIIF